MLKIYYVDIDLTICFTPTKDGLPDYSNSVPCQKNIDSINKLFYEGGNQIIYWTARGAKTGIDWTELTEKQLDKWGCRYHGLRLDKPYYDHLIDDKAWRLPDVKEE